jgi:acetylglutamate kinase
MPNKPSLTIVKIGGNVLDDEASLQQLLEDFSEIEGAKILVHGGGKLASRTAEKLGLTPVFSSGRRITDEPMLEVAVMAYAGWISKTITATLQMLGENALGLSGADGNLILAIKRAAEPIDFGFVGDVIGVNSKNLGILIDSGFTPIFSAITHDGAGQLLNTNADTIAAEIAIACSVDYAVSLWYCFEKKGVLSDSENDESVIEKLTFEAYAALREKNAVHSGMLPKLENCFRALQNGVEKIRIGNPGMLRRDAVQFTQIAN